MKATFITAFKAITKSGVNAGKVAERYLHSVSGTAEELASFKKASGEFYAEDAKGTPLYYSNQPNGKSFPIAVSAKTGKVVVMLSDLERAEALTQQFPGLIGQEIARQAVAKLNAERASTSAPVAVSQPEKKLED